MLSIIFLYLTLFIYVNSVVGLDSFFQKGQRAEIFELADNEVPEFRITLPDKHFLKLKDYYKQHNISSLRFLFNELEHEIVEYIFYLQNCNFTESFPNLNPNDFPELNIMENGYSNFDSKEILQGFKLNEYQFPEYIPYDSNMEFPVKLKVFQSNKDFDLLKILTTLAAMTDFNDPSQYNTVTFDLSFFKFVKKTDNEYYYDKSNEMKYFDLIVQLQGSEKLNTINNINYDIKKVASNLKRILYLLKEYNFSNISSQFDYKNKYPELKIDEDGFAKFNIENVMNNFNFDFKKYMDIDNNQKFRDIFFNILHTNQKFDLLNILIHLSNLTEFRDITTDNELTRRLVYYKFIIKNDDNTFDFNMKSMASFLKTYCKNDINYSDENISNNLFFDENTSQYKLVGMDDSLYDNFNYNIKEVLQSTLKNILDYLLKFNFKENNLYTMKDEFPELKIGDDGIPKFSISEIYDNFKNNIDNYGSVDIEYTDNEIQIQALQLYKDFRLINILMKIAETTDFEKSYCQDDLVKKLTMFKFIKLIENNQYEIDENEYEKYINNMNNPEDESNKFKTKDGSLIVKINGKINKFKKVTFSVGGNSSRSFSKPQYNIKIRGGNDLFGRTQFKLRSDSKDPSYMRTKIISDILNRLDLPSVSASYMTLYINDEFMGLYILTDRYKLSWVEYVYGEKNTTTLYKCDSCHLDSYCIYCTNENEEVTDNTEWLTFVKNLDKAQSSTDIENIFDVDLFLKEMALEYLFGAFDHFYNGHNYYMYRKKNGQWQYLIFDFDYELGTHTGFGNETVNEYFSKYRYHHIIDILDIKNSSKFKNILKDIVAKIFNPAILFPHIDYLKEFIRPYVLQDKTMTSLGYYPGRLNYNNNDVYTPDQWEANCNFTKIKTYWGIKKWILERYRNICNFYSMECDPIYMDENYEYSADKDQNQSKNENKKEDENKEILLTSTDTNETEINTDLFKKDNPIKTISITKTFTKTSKETITAFAE